MRLAEALAENLDSVESVSRLKITAELTDWIKQDQMSPRTGKLP